MGKLVWRVKLVAETGGPATEIEVARIEREDWAVPEALGLSLDEGKSIAAAIQAEMVRAQASTMSEHFRSCGHCGLNFAEQGISEHDLSIAVRRRAAQSSAIRRLPMSRPTGGAKKLLGVGS